MSDEIGSVITGRDERNTMGDNDDATEAPAGVETKAKRNTVPWDQLRAMITTIPQYDKAAFLMVGHSTGVRLAIPKTGRGVSRAYFYGNGDYSLIPESPAILTFSLEDRKRLRKGGIMAEVDFTAEVDVVVSALEALVAVVRVAEPPSARTTRAKGSKSTVEVGLTEVDADDTAPQDS